VSSSGTENELKFDVSPNDLQKLAASRTLRPADGQLLKHKYLVSSFAKYVALQETGVSAPDVRIVILGDSIRRPYHAVLAARFNGNWFMLDNRLMMTIKSGGINPYLSSIIMACDFTLKDPSQ
jgi:hypothetical protein